MPTRGNPTDGLDGESPSTAFRIGRVTVGAWTLMRYPDDERDERRRDDEVADECRSDRSDDGKRCASCRTEIDPTRRHPAAVVPRDPSTVYLFCSDDCRAAWIDGGSDS